MSIMGSNLLSTTPLTETVLAFLDVSLVPYEKPFRDTCGSLFPVEPRVFGISASGLNDVNFLRGLKARP